MYNGEVRRTQLYLDEPLDDELRQVAAVEGRSAASIVREAVGLYLGQRRRTSGDDDPIRALIGAFEGKHDAALHHDRYLYGADG